VLGVAASSNLLSVRTAIRIMTPNDEDGNLARYVDQTGHDIVSSVSCDLPAWHPWQRRRN
jgi:hypothetical protein